MQARPWPSGLRERYRVDPIVGAWLVGKQRNDGAGMIAFDFAASGLPVGTWSDRLTETNSLVCWIGVLRCLAREPRSTSPRINVSARSLTRSLQACSVGTLL